MARKKKIPAKNDKKLRVGMRVLLKKNYKLAVVEKIHPKYSDEFVVSYYGDHNRLCYDIITERDVLPAADYEIIKNRNNRINDIFRDD